MNTTELAALVYGKIEAVIKEYDKQNKEKDSRNAILFCVLTNIIFDRWTYHNFMYTSFFVFDAGFDHDRNGFWF